MTSMFSSRYSLVHVILVTDKCILVGCGDAHRQSQHFGVLKPEDHRFETSLGDFAT